MKRGESKDCLLQFRLPPDMDRILYLDADIIIDGDIEALYHTDLQDQYLAACGQYYKEVDGNFFKIGADPKKGDCFNSGVVIFNLNKFRTNVTFCTYKEAAEVSGYNFSLADQGILNIVFWNKCIYLDTMLYNFRLSMYEDYLRDGNSGLVHPVIYHYVMRDNYNIGYASKPWQLLLNSREYELLRKCGKIRVPHQLEQREQMNWIMQNKWWKYAKKAPFYAEIKSNMMRNKTSVLKHVLENRTGREILDLLKIEAQRATTFQQLKNDDRCKLDSGLTYLDLEHSVDEMPPDDAIRTMNCLFRQNCENMCNKGKIKVGFLVYSSSEWQCDNLYWLFEEDKRFVPSIVVCGYNQGTLAQKREVYMDVCRYFRESSKEYRIVYAGYLPEASEEVADMFDILVYLSPFGGLLPKYLNIENRKLRQLCIHIPYGYYTEDKEDAHYDDFYNMRTFKYSWKYFAECRRQKEDASCHQRLNGYNIYASGLPKIDSLREGTYAKRADIWKSDGTSLKLIWAPHFNPNYSTFKENYQWLYNYAQTHREISWILRPHPRMESGVLQSGIFRTREDYKHYLDQWNELPNARVVERGDYYDIFDSSDGMILDSFSFVAEYQFTGKPLLFLKPQKPRALNQWGAELASVVYQAPGNDFRSIEEFIEHVKKHIDPQKEKREEFLHKVLLNYEGSSLSASENVYKVIVSAVTNLGSSL